MRASNKDIFFLLRTSDLHTNFDAFFARARMNGMRDEKLFARQIAFARFCIIKYYR